jgi:hypothetical protein
LLVILDAIVNIVGGTYMSERERKTKRAPIFGVSVNEGCFILIMVVSSFVNPKHVY